MIAPLTSKHTAWAPCLSNPQWFAPPRYRAIAPADQPQVTLDFSNPTEPQTPRYRVVAPTMLGCTSLTPGSSSDRPPDVKAYSLGAVAEGIAAMMDGMGIPKAVVVGHDW